MNLKFIDAAIASYADSIDEADKRRLDFLRGLWGVQADHIRPDDDYDVPDESALRDYFVSGKPILSGAGVDINGNALASVCHDLAQAIVDSGYFAAEPCAELNRVVWKDLISSTDTAVAGSEPFTWLEMLAGAIPAEYDEQTGRLVILIGSMALQTQLEKPAKKIMKALDDAEITDPHPLNCPICGCAPTLAHVGGETSSSGRGRLLVCPQCATAWEFERVRCARCGTQNQAHLHFFNLEGDDTHRIATCDECGGYIRTTFSEDKLSIVSYKVEDVIMAKLDAIAQDPRFHEEAEESKQKN